MNKRKIFNDPVYGFIAVPYEVIFDLIEHPYVQRLRRISQVGLTHLTYPGALHTRFHHALGALHLMTMAIDSLRSKGVVITDAEAEAASVAILLHDLGHGPFSHALEGVLVQAQHEELSHALISRLNDQVDGTLQMALDIFTDQYPKRFLHQLISSQLDMDRMDYLNRDSFYSGVMEGTIGYDRIITMLQVRDDELVVEEKGIYSIEKFLVARKIMYWQVYLHKTVLSAELMLIGAIHRIKELYQAGELEVRSPLSDLFELQWSEEGHRDAILRSFVRLDDIDIISLLKDCATSADFVLQMLASGLIDRRLFKVELMTAAPTPDRLQALVTAVAAQRGIDIATAHQLVWSGTVGTDIYTSSDQEIKILRKSGEVVPFSKWEGHQPMEGRLSKHYLGYPKLG